MAISYLYTDMLKRNFYVYILTNEIESVLYVGVTNNLMRRLDEHRNKSDPGAFTSKYKINKLVYFEEFQDIYSAITREKQIKGGSRFDKLNLIQSINPNWNDLSVAW